MTRRLLALLSLGLASGIDLDLVSAQPAPPASPSSAVELAWVRGEGAEGCATQPTITRRVVERLGRNPFSTPAERVVEAIVFAEAGTMKVRLFSRTSSGEPLGERAFESTAPGCAAIEDAAVLAIALMIDPAAALAPPPSADPPAPEPPVAPEGAAPPPVLVPVWIPVPAPAPTPVWSPRPLREPWAPRAMALAHVEGLVGPLPRLALSGGLGVDVEIVPRFHLAAAMRWSPEVESADGDFAFSLVRGELSGCGDALSGAAWALSGCGSIAAGAMTASSLRLEPVDPGEDPWLEVGARARALVAPAGPWVVGLELALQVPLLRPSYAVLGAGEPAFEPAAIAGSLGLSTGVRFP